jgi:hypothetical protein
MAINECLYSSRSEGWSAVRAVYVAGFEMERSAGFVLLALVGEVAFNHVERLGHAFMVMCRNNRAGLHNDVQHYWPERVVRVADGQRDVAGDSGGDSGGL